MMTRTSRLFIVTITITTGFLFAVACTFDLSSLGSGPALSLTGAISADSTNAKGITRAADSATANENFQVIAQSVETGKIFRGMTDANGNFNVEITGAEAGNTFMVAVQKPNGQLAGPVLFGTNNNEGVTGLSLTQSSSLGTVQMPDNPNVSPIQPGADGNVSAKADEQVVAKLDANGVPVGVTSNGKGNAAQGQVSTSTMLAFDRDRDGLIDLFDADDNGNGTVDDFESGGSVGGIPDTDITVNFFMNLKINSENAQTYYEGSASAISTALGNDTIITMECFMNSGATRSITSVKALDAPAPDYLATSDQQTNGGGGLQYENWADEDYAFDEAGDRHQAFVRPNTVMDAGDAFTIEVTFNNGTTTQYSRMVNFVFKNIPKLVKYGVAGSLTNFDVSNANINGTMQKPIPFDGTQDLTLEFQPPVDEDGNLLTDLDYFFTIFYNDANGTQLNGDIDASATFTTTITDFNTQTFNFTVENSSLTLSSDNTYTVTLPKEIFPTTVQTGTGAETVDTYKVDIAAQSNGNNSSINLIYDKQ